MQNQSKRDTQLKTDLTKVPFYVQANRGTRFSYGRRLLIWGYFFAGKTDLSKGKQYSKGNLGVPMHFLQVIQKEEEEEEAPYIARRFLTLIRRH